MARETKPITRPGASILLINEPDEVLLYPIPASEPGIITVWVTPGGALRPGESYRKAALREALEETGVTLSSADLLHRTGSSQNVQTDTQGDDC